MNKISEILSTFFAYLKRPDLYELRRKFGKTSLTDLLLCRGKEEAEKWCASIAISEKDFIEKVLNTSLFLLKNSFLRSLQKHCKSRQKHQSN
jgi:hypothetical protein